MYTRARANWDTSHQRSFPGHGVAGSVAACPPRSLVPVQCCLRTNPHSANRPALKAYSLGDVLRVARRQPFVDEDRFVQTLFPDWTYAIKLPAVLFVVLVTLIVTFISLVMIKSRKPKSS